MITVMVRFGSVWFNSVMVRLGFIIFGHMANWLMWRTNYGELAMANWLMWRTNYGELAYGELENGQRNVTILNPKIK